MTGTFGKAKAGVRIALELCLKRRATLLVPTVFLPCERTGGGSSSPEQRHWLAVSALVLLENGETHSRLGRPYGWYVLSFAR